MLIKRRKNMNMPKMIAKIALVLGMLLGAASSVYAYNNYISISKLPEYVNSNAIEISYSALSSDSINVQFCYRKEGESYKTFGPVFTNPSGRVQVTGSQMNDQMVKYYFRVTLNGADCSSSSFDETSTIYDYSGPSPVSNFNKEYKGGGYWRLSWTNPHDSDFSRVFIYRSENRSFTADGSTKVGETGGAYSADVSWDNYGLDQTKKYYYAIRAVDKAGNPSSVVGDSETVTVLGVVAPTVASEEVVKIIPKVTSKVLAKEDEVVTVTVTLAPTITPTPAAAKTENVVEKFMGNMSTAKILVYVLLGLGVGMIIYSFFRKNK
jgi:hypothetical protein